MSAPLLPDDLESGSVLDGRYRIDGVIGGGGTARVYRAEHLAISRPVAIKVLHVGVSRNREAVERFRREATTSGRLVHPNIVAVTDFGTLPDGRGYLVMEALDGETVADRLDREGELPWEVAVSLLAELLRGLRHAHAHGVIHRDIKPENIFILRGDGGPRVKILDFGIAKLHAASIAAEPRITQGGLTIGTPRYMSPEQTLDGQITPASDLYSSTVVLYEMLTGMPPFYRDDPVATMKAHLHETPPRLRDVAPELEFPDELEEIIRRGLEKLAVDRIPSADAYLKMLERLGVVFEAEPRISRARTAPPVGEPATAATTPSSSGPSVRLEAAAPPAAELVGHVSAPPPGRRRTRRLALVGAPLVAGAAGLVAYLALRAPDDRGPAPAVTAGTAEPVAAASPTSPASSDASAAARPSPGAAPSPGTPADRRPPQTAAPAARDREQVKRWLAAGSRALAAGRFAEAGAQLRRAVAADATAHAAHAGLAEVAYQEGDFARAAQSARRAVSLSPGTAAYRMTLAKAYYKLAQYDAAIAQWQKALELEPSNERAKKNIEMARAKRGR